MAGMPPSSFSYPSGPQAFTQTPLGANHLTASMSGLSLHPEGLRVVNLLQERNMLPSTPLQPPVPNLHEDIQKLNCNPELFRCTLTGIPQTQALLNKAKLPLGLLLHPFKDLVVCFTNKSKCLLEDDLSREEFFIIGKNLFDLYLGI